MRCFRPKIKELALAVMAIASASCYAYEQIPIYTDDNQEAFYLNFFSPGESAFWITGDFYSQESSTYSLTNDEVLSIQEGFGYWANVLNVKSPMQVGIVANDNNINNAYGSPAFDVYGQFLAPHIINGNIGSDILSGVFTVNKWSTTPDGHLPYEKISLLPNYDVISLSSIAVHEAAHIMGMISIVSVFGFGSDAMPLDQFPLSQFDLHLYDLNHNNLANASYHQEIGYGDINNIPQDSKAFVSFGYYTAQDIYDHVGYVANESGVYFRGDNVDEVLNGALLEHANSVTGILYPGIPLQGFESPYKPDWSHLELQGSLLSHQNFRNWNTLMEAEMAFFEDLGFNIDRRKYFGYSIYNSGTPTERYSFVNTNPYYERNERGDAYLVGVASTTKYGIGLHIYGSYTDVLQKADILANGSYSAGIRLEGVNNELVVDQDTNIHVNGAYGYGLLVDFGKDHYISHFGSIEALGQGGIGVAFDFGSGAMGASSAGIGSCFTYGDATYYIDYKKINSALVESFEVYGSIKGQLASIYIANNALVNNINIYDGAYLQGDIISNWDPLLNDFVNRNNFVFFDYIVSDTSLNFYQNPDLSRGAKAQIVVDGNIRGEKSIEIYNSTNTTINGYAQVLNFTNDGKILFTGATEDGYGLYVANNLDLLADSSIGLNVDKNGKIQNKIKVGNYASIDGSFFLNAVPDFYASNTEFVVDVDLSSIIEANNLYGSFDSENYMITSSSQSLNFSIVDFTNNKLTVVVNREPDAYQIYAKDVNTQNMARAMSYTAQDSNTPLSNIISYLDFTNVQDAQATLSKLSATNYDLGSYISLQHLDLINNSINANYLENIHSQSDVFIKTFFAHTAYEEKYDFDYDSYGFVVGAKLFDTDNTSLALNFGASRLDADLNNDNQGEFSSNSALVGVNYNIFNQDRDLYLLLSTNYMYWDSQAKRTLYINNQQYDNQADFTSHALINSATLVKDLNVNKFDVSLYTSLHYNLYYQNDLDESGSVTALHLDSNLEYALPWRVGGNLKYNLWANDDANLALDLNGAFKLNLLPHSYESEYSFVNSAYTISTQTRMESTAGFETGAKLSYVSKHGFNCSLELAGGFDRFSSTFNTNLNLGYKF